MDGIFDNPNHYFRIKLIIEALREINHFKVVAIISSKIKLNQLNFARNWCKKFYLHR